MSAPIPLFLAIAFEHQVITQQEMEQIAQQIHEAPVGDVEMPENLQNALNRVGLFLTESPGKMLN